VARLTDSAQRPEGRLSRPGLAWCNHTRWLAVPTATLMCLASSVPAQSLDGCQGPPSETTSVSKPAVVFVWPCYAASDTFLAPDPREVEFARDRDMRAQYRRLRDRVSAAGGELLEASGALNLSFVSSSGSTEQVRTTKVNWRGVLIHCPGQTLRKLNVPGAPLPDKAILEPLEGCGHRRNQPR
jgi:hypothetical protein